MFGSVEREPVGLVDPEEAWVGSARSASVTTRPSSSADLRTGARATTASRQLVSLAWRRRELYTEARGVLKQHGRTADDDRRVASGSLTALPFVPRRPRQATVPVSSAPDEESAARFRLDAKAALQVARAFLDRAQGQGWLLRVTEEMKFSSQTTEDHITVYMNDGVVGPLAAAMALCLDRKSGEVVNAFTTDIHGRVKQDYPGLVAAVKWGWRLGEPRPHR